MTKIRRLTMKDDLHSVTQLLQRFFNEEGFDTPADVIARNTERMVEIDQCGLFAAEHEGRAVGVATVSLDFGIEYGWSAEMGDLYVLPEWRRKGVSSSLVRAIEDFLRSRKIEGYAVSITPFSARHHDLERFYERLGFANEGRVIFYRQLK